MPESISRPTTSASITWLSPIEWSTLKRYTGKVRSLYGDRIYKMILFGSRVRGEGNEDSDLDVAVIIATKELYLQRGLYDIATELWLETEIKISPLLFSIEEFAKLLQMGRGIAVTIYNEGILL